ncbi:MAG: metallophosphoesterase [Clostridia bacterium]|nr:metallophosphoesterase [Clostridia bacterium]
MAIWAISDFHLSFGVKDKPMNVFGENWNGYEEKLRENWIAKVKPDDTVLMAGDFSWGMYLEETIEDFAFLKELPGRKIMVKGNHDYWWETLSKMKAFMKEQKFENIEFLHNNFFVVGDTAICGTRGWEIGCEDLPADQDRKVYLREKERLVRSLNLAKEAGYRKMIVMLHYNLSNNREYLEIMKRYPVSDCVYGHLHGKAESLVTENSGIRFSCTSCDLIGFDPILIEE